MSNRKKLTRTKLPKPSMEDAIAAIGKAAETNPEIVVPTHLNRQQLRSMRRRVPVIAVLAPALDSASSISSHRHDPTCSHYVPEGN